MYTTSQNTFSPVDYTFTIIFVLNIDLFVKYFVI